MRFESINFFRGIAVLMVVFIHSYNFFDYNSPAYPAFFLRYVENFQFGVQFFFILSALTLCNSYDYSLKKGENHLISNFYKKRFFRIYPMFFLLMLVFLVYNRVSYSTLYKALNFVFLNNYHPPLGNRGIVSFSWTINVEMSFYLIFPFLFMWLRKFPFLVVFPPLIDQGFQALKRLARANPDITEQVFRIRPEDLDPFTYRHLMSQFSIFILGFILYQVLFYDDKRTALYKNLVIGALMIADFIFPFQSWQLGISYIFYFIIYFLFRFDYHQIGLAQIKRIGICSYSIYLLHFFGIELVRYLDLWHVTGHALFDCVFRFLIVLGVTWGMAEITLRFIEDPMIQFGKRFLRK